MIRYVGNKIDNSNYFGETLIKDYQSIKGADLGAGGGVRSISRGAGASAQYSFSMPEFTY